jgi:hypothetical protein
MQSVGFLRVYIGPEIRMACTIYTGKISIAIAQAIQQFI